MRPRTTKPRPAAAIAAASLALACAAALAPSTAQAECDRLTRPLANRVAAAVRANAPPWARSLLTGEQLMRFDSGSLHPMTFFLGYGQITLERVGTGGVAPYSAAVVVQCRTGRVEFVREPYVWANARARALHLTIANAEQAAGYAAEVASLGAGRRPDGANATRRGPVWNVDVSLAARQGDSSAAGAAQSLRIEVGRDASIRLLGPSS